MNRLFDRINVVLKPAIIVLFCFSCGEVRLFDKLSVGRTGIDFSNEIVETEKLNIERNQFMYNGGGVAVGDVNNDGLPDIYMTANQNPDKLFLNKGGMKFMDATTSSGITIASNAWSTGVIMADVNGDSWLDIYVCHVFGALGFDEGNSLYVNNGDGTFTDKAEEYGLRGRSYAQHAAFFDYDQDGDLDMFLLNLSMVSLDKNPSEAQDSLAWDRLYENKGNIFVDVSKKAGIIQSATAFGLSVGIGDVNNDGWPDIYVANDFSDADVLYINQGNGTFIESGQKTMGHVSFSSHGNDIADVNNDGWLDIFTTDRKPVNEFILKTTLSSDNIGGLLLEANPGYSQQSQRNMLQINQGDLFVQFPGFSEVGEMTGVSATDWSWSPLFADFDLDGQKDLFITNGIPRRPLDLDFLSNKSGKDSDSLAQHHLASFAKMPNGESKNVAFKNIDGKFKDVSIAWGLDLMGNSNGAAYADLDNDGDLDLILNNLNANASIYENNASKHSNNNFIKIKFEGRPGNVFGIGARVTLYIAGEQQTQELYTAKGWLSSMDQCLVFGLGKNQMIDSLQVDWLYGKGQVLNNIQSNQSLTLKYTNAGEKRVEKFMGAKPVFESMDQRLGIDYIHKENDFVDFDYEKLIPKMISREGPKITIGDVNNDGLGDFYIGGAKNQAAALYIQQTGGGVTFRKIDNEAFYKDRVFEDAGSVFIDVDLDSDLDLYVVSGGGELFRDFTLTDRLYFNDGQGQFSKSAQHPQLSFNGSCAVAGDYNQDGVMDIFVGGRSLPGSYGKYPKSRILLGDGEGHLYDATERAFGDKINLGMVTDAVWLGKSKELVIVGEWLPITILSFRDGRIEEKKLPNTSGWWNTIYATDMDGDGDMDLVAGNYGLNSNLTASPEHPLNLYLKDFDNDGGTDPILAHFREGVEYPYFDLDKMTMQLPAFKKEYPTYEAYARSTFAELFPPDEMKGAGRWQVQQLQSLYLENKGPGDFVLSPLPEALQVAPIYGFCSDDFDGDGRQELLAAGNLYGNQPAIGKLDASYGHYLTMDEHGNWEGIKAGNSGFVVEGEARCISLLKDAEGKKIILVARNNAAVQVFKVR